MTAKMFLIRCDSSRASRSRLSDRRRVSSISVIVPNHCVTSPSAPNIGTARVSIQRYSPSWRRRRFSHSNGSRVGDRLLPRLDHRPIVVGMDEDRPDLAQVVERRAGEFGPAAVEIVGLALGPGRPGDIGDRIRQRLEPGIALLELARCRQAGAPRAQPPHDCQRPARSGPAVCSSVRPPGRGVAVDHAQRAERRAFLRHQRHGRHRSG